MRRWLAAPALVALPAAAAGAPGSHDDDACAPAGIAAIAGGLDC